MIFDVIILFLKLCYYIISFYVRNMNKNNYNRLALQGGNSQKFLSKFLRFLVTLGLKILRLFRMGDVNYCLDYKVPIFYV